ncbi:hypothetical protein KUTeg_022522 [Tegillarca granosa]|uniref:BCL2-associated athanogene 6 n=1 Tax=Tegillarca granosa TaxID=220873 RepID=A0ABQ9ECL5_TEGGR|nr:hypothetical protein KUTeg_022522 [Tegillarca granosa]
MMDVTVKTLDGQNRSYSVPENITVKQFKEKIASSINISVETQRLIFQGRVMQDDKALKDYNVHGNVIHVVQGPPPSARRSNLPNSSTGTPRGTPGAGGRDAIGVVGGSFTLPSDIMDPNQVQDIVQQALSGMGDIGRGARVSTRASNPNQSSENRSESQVNTSTSQTTPSSQSAPTSQSASSPMDTSESQETRSESQTESEPSQSNNQASGGGTQPRGPQRPHVRALADILDEVHVENQDQLRTSNTIHEILHAISHCYHNLSDLMIDTNQSPPRLAAAFVTPLSTAIIQQTIPMHAQIHVENPRTVRRNTGTQSTVSTSSTSTSTSVPSTNAASQTVGNATSGTTATSTTSTTATDQFPGIPAGAAGGPRIGLSTDPYTFLEVGPEHVTVNSISAHVVETEVPNTSASRTSSTTTGPQGTQQSGAVYQDLIQGIVSAIMQAHTGGRVAPGNAPNGASNVPTSTASAASTQTTTDQSQQNNSGTQTSTAPTSTSGTQTPGSQPRTAAFVMPGIPLSMPNIPGMSGIGGIGGMGQRPVDPYLSCSSRHFVTMQATNLHNQQQQHQQPNARTQSQTTQPSQTTQASSANNRTSTPRQSTQTPTSTSNSSSSNLPPPPPLNPFAGLAAASGGSIPGLPPGMAAMFNTFSSRPTGSTSSSTGQSASGGMSQGEPQFVQVLRSMLQTAGNESQQGQGQRGQSTQSTTTTSTSTGSTISSTTTSTGTSSSSNQQPVMTDEAFTQLVQGIGQFVSQAAIGQESNQSISDFLSTLGDNYNFSSGEGTGFINDVFNCVSSQLTFPDLVQVFFGNSAPLNIIRNPLQDFLRQRILNGQEPTAENITAGVDRLVEDMQDELLTASRYITNGINPMIQQWMIGVSSQQLANFNPTCNIREEEVAHYIVRKVERSNQADNEVAAMETQSPPSTSATVSPQSMEVGNSEVVSGSKAASSKNPTVNGIGAVSESATVAEAEPAGAEWVPIITQDVQKQQKQKPQAPLSDAYLQGMPAKRRKIMTQDRPMNLSNTADVIPDSIRRAVAAAGVEPISSMENLTNEVTENSELQSAFEDQISSTLSERLENDNDYRPERFPNSAEYFKQNKSHNKK